MAKARMTPADHAASENLKRIWDRRRQERHELTQAKAAEDLDWSEGMVSQHLRGITPLGVKATYRWAAYLDISPYEIRPDLDVLLGAEVKTKNRPPVNERLLEEAITEVDRVLQEIGVQLSSKEKGRLAANAYMDALESGKINREVIRGIARFVAS